MKSFGQKSWMLPQPVLIIGTYDKNGKPNAMNIILPKNRTGQGCMTNLIKTLYKYGQQFKKEAFLRVQGQGGLIGVERTNDIAGARSLRAR